MRQEQIGLETVLRRPLGVRIRRFRGKLLVAVAENTYELTDSAAEIFGWMNGSSTVGAIGEKLSAAYGLPPEESAGDVQEFAAWLLDRRLAEIATTPHPPS